MTKTAKVTIELPLPDEVMLEDAVALGKAAERVGVSRNLGRRLGFLPVPYGWVTKITLEDREPERPWEEP